MTIVYRVAWATVSTALTKMDFYLTVESSAASLSGSTMPFTTTLTPSTVTVSGSGVSLFSNDGASLLQHESLSNHTGAATVVSSPQPTFNDAINYTTAPITPSLSSNSVPLLPTYTIMSTPTFVWGTCNAETFTQLLDNAYLEVVHWKPNKFKLPRGNAGKAFVLELTRLYKAFATGSALESVALKAAVIFPIIVLQKPSRSSKHKNNRSCLERRMPLWLDGNLAELLHEGRTIQKRLPKSTPGSKKKDKSPSARIFSQNMFQGKTKAALNVVRQKGKSGLMTKSLQVRMAQ